MPAELYPEPTGRSLTPDEARTQCDASTNRPPQGFTIHEASEEDRSDEDIEFVPGMSREGEEQ